MSCCRYPNINAVERDRRPLGQGFKTFTQVISIWGLTTYIQSAVKNRPLLYDIDFEFAQQSVSLALHCLALLCARNLNFDEICLDLSGTMCIKKLRSKFMSKTLSLMCFPLYFITLYQYVRKKVERILKNMKIETSQ